MVNVEFEVDLLPPAFMVVFPWLLELGPALSSTLDALMLGATGVAVSIGMRALLRNLKAAPEERKS
jgi:hypothetical protein